MTDPAPTNSYMKKRSQRQSKNLPGKLTWVTHLKHNQCDRWGMKSEPHIREAFSQQGRHWGSLIGNTWWPLSFFLQTPETLEFLWSHYMVCPFNFFPSIFGTDINTPLFAFSILVMKGCEEIREHCIFGKS